LGGAPRDILDLGHDLSSHNTEENPIMNTKRITLFIAVLSAVATGLLALEGVLPPAWAALFASLGAGAYALVRALQKVAAGQALKSLLSTTEAWGVGLAILAPVLLSIAGLLPPQYAAPIAVLAGVLLKVARSLQAEKVPEIATDPAAPLPERKKTPVTVPLKTKGPTP
jgi:hypothetical protein